MSIQQSEMSATFTEIVDSQAKPSINLGWLLLVLGLGLTEASCCLFERI